MKDKKFSPSEAITVYSFVLAPKRLLVGLALAAFFLLGVHSMLTVYHYQIEEVSWLPWRQLFDVDEENNLPTWFSGAILALAAGCLWLCARHKRQVRDRSVNQWYVLTFGFLFMSVDEVAGLHESLNSTIQSSWVIPGGIVAFLVGLSFIPFLWNLPSRTRNYFIVAGALYVGGAIGVEIIGAPMDADTMLYNLTTVAEEGLEMFGVILFLIALLSYMRPAAGGAIEVDVGLQE